MEIPFGFSRRVRLVRQTEATECGLAALTMVAGYHGFEIGLSALRREFQSSVRGSSLGDLVRIADRLMIDARPVRIELEELGALLLPAILHWDLKHFVVVEEVRRGRALIHDPAGSSRWMPMAEVSRHFTGVALELEPSSEFEAHTYRDRLRLRQLWHRLTGLKRALVQVAILSLVMQAYILCAPYFMQLAVDSAVPALDGSLLVVLALGFGLFALVNAGADLLRSFVLLSAGAAFGYGVATNIVRRLVRLPVSWFERRHIGDILSRFQSIVPIRQFMTEGAVATVLDGSLASLTLLLMLVYSVPLTLIALAACLSYALLRFALFARQQEAQGLQISKGGQEQSTMIETLRGITTLRLYNREAERLALWRNKLTDSTNAGVITARLAAYQTAGNRAIRAIENVFSIWVGANAVIGGTLSLGMLFAFMAYKAEFLQKSSTFIDNGINFRFLRLHLDRLSDIALAEVDASYARRGGVRRALVGRVELRDVGFRYSASDPFILRNLNFVAEAGEHVAITGPSGGGKTTLAKILLGLIEPSEGQVLVDGEPLAQFGYKQYHDQIAAVLQDDHLFAGTLADNIALFDNNPDAERIETAARFAAFDADIARMPMGYDTLVGDMGGALSGGQRQRVLLARALYRSPRLLMMDEGTSQLDPRNEAAVNEAIGSLGMTRILVAHRLETIVNADRILRLSDGKLSDVTAQMHAIRAQVRASAMLEK